MTGSPDTPSPFGAVSRRRFLQLAAGAGGGFMLGGLAGCVNGTSLTVASHVWPGYEFMFLARREGWLDDSGVTLLETPSASASADALRSGQVQAAALTLDEMLRLRGEGLRLSAVLVFDVSVGSDAVIARPGVDMSRLAGTRIGVEVGAVGWLMLNRLLDTARVPLQEVILVPLALEQHVEALVDGRVDVVITFEPGLRTLELRGFKRIFDSRQLPEMIFDVLAVRSDRMATRGQAISNIVEAHFRALGMMHRNPYDTAFQLAQRLQTRGQEVPALFSGLMLPGVEGNRSFLEANAGALHRAAAVISSLMFEHKLLRQPDTLAELVSDAYLPYQKVF